jgi:hypothetical protein
MPHVRPDGWDRDPDERSPYDEARLGRGQRSPTALAMRALAAAALGAFLAAVLAVAPGTGPIPPAVAHVFFALGAMPLIAGAMIYFTPVLTRSRTPHARWLSIPALALAAGALAVAAVAQDRALVAPAAALGMLAAGLLLGWMTRRARSTVGRPHPCLEWYRLALLALLLGLAAVWLVQFFPAQAPAWRRFHLHINTLGFIGMTAFGTLRVLLPTAAGYGDTRASAALARWGWPVFIGTLAVAAGAAAGSPALVWPGLLLWVLPVAFFLWDVFVYHRRAVFARGRASGALALAAAGWLALLATSALHAAGDGAPSLAIGLFVLCFLLPLVTAAVSVLWPVWVWPGGSDPGARALAARLARGAGWRSAAFLGSGALYAAGFAAAWLLAAAVLALFLLQCAGSLLAVARAGREGGEA